MLLHIPSSRHLVMIVTRRVHCLPVSQTLLLVRGRTRPVFLPLCPSPELRARLHNTDSLKRGVNESIVTFDARDAIPIGQMRKGRVRQVN